MLLLAPFASKLVNYSRHIESLNNQKNSEIDEIFLRWEPFVDFQTYFKDSLCHTKLTNFNAKGAKRSVKIGTTSFYKSIFKNILFYMSSRLSKIYSVHTHVMPRTVESVLGIYERSFRGRGLLWRKSNFQRCENWSLKVFWDPWLQKVLNGCKRTFVSHFH